jgi:uncharacterized protein
MATALTITHNPAASRFEAAVPGGPAVCAYSRVGNVLHFTHTEVPPALEGQGIAAALVQAAMQHARQEKLRVRPLCSYVASYLQRHPEFKDLVETSA